MDTLLGGKSPAPGTAEGSGGSRPPGLGSSQKQGQLSGWVVTDKERRGGAGGKSRATFNKPVVGSQEEGPSRFPRRLPL